MKVGHNHGIDSVNLRLAPGAWRIVVMFRNLRKIIKRQAINHQQICKNEDNNVEIMENCTCSLVR